MVVRALGLLMLFILARTQFAQQQKSSQIDDRFFVEKVYPLFEKAECRMCHNDDGMSSATRLQFPTPEAKTEAIRIFGPHTGG